MGYSHVGAMLQSAASCFHSAVHSRKKTAERKRREEKSEEGGGVDEPKTGGGGKTCLHPSRQSAAA
jgi:hypothetical protein